MVHVSKPNQPFGLVRFRFIKGIFSSGSLLASEPNQQFCWFTLKAFCFETEPALWAGSVSVYKGNFFLVVHSLLLNRTTNSHEAWFDLEAGSVSVQTLYNFIQELLASANGVSEI